MQLGRVWLRPSFAVPELGVDTNVYNEQGIRKPDFVVTVQPGLDVGIATRRFDLTVTPFTTLVRYRQSRTENSTTPGVRAKVERRFSSHVALMADGQTGTSRDRISFEVDTRAKRFFQDVAVGARLTTERSRLTVRASEAESHFDKDSQFLGVGLARELDRSSRAAAVESAYRLSSFTTAVISADLTSDRFLYAPERSMDSVRALGGFDFNPRALISGTIRVGVKHASPLREIAPPFTGLAASGGLGLTVRDSFSLSGGVQRDIDYSFRPDRPYFVYNLYEGAIRQALFRRLELGAGLSSAKLAYRQFGLPGSPEAASRYYEYLVNTSASLSVNVGSGRVGVYVARWERLSGAEAAYRSDRIGILASIGRTNVNDRGVFINGPGR
jgi:hypothetical protein